MNRQRTRRQFLSFSSAVAVGDVLLSATSARDLAPGRSGARPPGRTPEHHPTTGERPVTPYDDTPSTHLELLGCTFDRQVAAKDLLVASGVPSWEAWDKLNLTFHREYH